MKIQTILRIGVKRYESLLFSHDQNCSLFECVRQIIISLQGDPYNNNYDNDETDDMSECHPVDLQQPYFCDFHLF